MTRRGLRIPSNQRNQAFQNSMPLAQELRESIRVARNRECLIPPNVADGDCSAELNNSHLIGVEHLRPIAENGHVFEWDVTDIPNMVENLIIDGSISDDLLQIAIPKLKPANLNILRCTRRLACTAHDGPVFRTIDRRNLRMGDGEQQFLMGFRGIAGSLALCESVIDFVLSIRGTVGSSPFWTDRGMSQVVEAMLESKREALEGRTSLVREEMCKWQELYLDRQRRTGSIVSSIKTLEPKVRVACSSLYFGHRGQPVALTIIPSQTGTHATIVATARRSTNWLDSVMRSSHQEKELTEICDELSYLLASDPANALCHLIQSTYHFVISKRDYNNDAIISADERLAIAEIAAASWGAQA